MTSISDLSLTEQKYSDDLQEELDFTIRTGNLNKRDFIRQVWVDESVAINR